MINTRIMFHSLSAAMLMFAVLFSPSISAQQSYSAQEIIGKVVDADTGEPLSDVNIVAVWRIDRKYVGDDKALLNVLETVSDQDGSYRFSAWGPISLPPLADFRQGRDPVITYFKRGYWHEYADNGASSDIEYRRTPLGAFKHNGQTIKLRKWDGKDAKKYWWNLVFLADNLPTRYGGDWKKYPRMTWAIELENREIQQLAKFPYNARVNGFNFDRLSEEEKSYLMSAIK